MNGQAVKPHPWRGGRFMRATWQEPVTVLDAYDGWDVEALADPLAVPHTSGHARAGRRVAPPTGVHCHDRWSSCYLTECVYADYPVISGISLRAPIREADIVEQPHRDTAEEQPVPAAAPKHTATYSAVRRHAYQEGAEVRHGKDGRAYHLCQQCHRIPNDPAHRGFSTSAAALTEDDFHPFRIGGTRQDAGGRTRATCAACGKVPNSPRHKAAPVQDDSGPAMVPVMATDTAEPASVAPESDADRRRRYPKHAAEAHQFTDSGIRVPGKSGRTLKLCATCMKPGNAPAHRASRLETGTAPIPASVSRQRPAAVPPAAAAPVARAQSRKLVAAELQLLAIAVDQALALPVECLSWKLRLQLAALRKDIPAPQLPTLQPEAGEAPDVAQDAPTAQDVAAAPSMAPHTRPTAPAAVGAQLVRSIRNDRIRLLVQRALQNGFDVTRTGSGHLRLARGQRSVILSATATADARSFKNARAELKRAGLDVAGL